MQRCKRFFVTACDILVLMGAAGLILPSSIYGKNAPPQTEEERNASPGQGDEHRADPCDHLPDPPGNANGIDKQCPPLGSSGGVAKGDFNGDGFADLAIGVPFEDLVSNSKADAGAVQVFFGSRSEELVTTDGNMFIEQSSVSGLSVEAGDLFGWALAVGDFDGDGRADLAIGSPGEDVGAITDAGLVTVIYGSSGGPNLTRTQNWTQDSSGILDTAEVGDQFGYALSAWNYGRGNQSDLAIGVPFEDVVSALDGTQQVDAGAVNVIYGSATTGLSATGNQFWHQDSPGIFDTAQPGDRFGSTLY